MTVSSFPTIFSQFYSAQFFESGFQCPPSPRSFHCSVSTVFRYFWYFHRDFLAQQGEEFRTFEYFIKFLISFYFQSKGEQFFLEFFNHFNAFWGYFFFLKPLVFIFYGNKIGLFQVMIEFEDFDHFDYFVDSD